MIHQLVSVLLRLGIELCAQVGGLVILASERFVNITEWIHILATALSSRTPPRYAGSTFPFAVPFMFISRNSSSKSNDQHR